MGTWQYDRVGFMIRRHATTLGLAGVLSCLALAPSAEAAGDNVTAWGGNTDGQLGNGATTPAYTPVGVSGLMDAVSVAAGANFSLALMSDGTVRAWGSNSHGELGNGNSTGPDTCGSFPCAKTPVPVSGLSGVRAIAASRGDSGNFGMAVLSDGTVRAWGRNYEGQLGNGTTNDSSTPVQVSGLSGVVAVAAGADHSLALLSDGTVKAWGTSGAGQLGDGNTTGPNTCNGNPCAQTPVTVSGLSGVVAIAAGYNHNLALLSDGTVKAWGFNPYGQLGNATTTSAATPVAVSGLSGVTSVAATGLSSMALLADGTVRSWGFNSDGELGIGSNTGPDTCGPQACAKTPVAVSGLSGVAAIAGGIVHGLALLSDGSVRAWGDNSAGELGTGSNTGPDSCGGSACAKSPVAVSSLSGATAISGGSTHSLALIGPASRLSVTLTGTGSGTVAGSGILCPPLCAHAYPQGAFAFLHAGASPGSGFAGFSGACSGTGLCLVQLSTDRSVTATFGAPKGTTITKAKINKKHHSATFSFSAPGAITGFQCALIKQAKKHKKKHKKLKPKFKPCSSPVRYKHLKKGRYIFEVRALDALGVDPTPAQTHFKLG